MTWLYVVGPITALLLLILFADVVLKVGYDKDFTVRLRWLFLTFRLYPPKEKKKKERNAPEGEKNEKKKSGSGISFSGVMEALGELKRILGDVLRRTRVSPCRAHITVATGDAASTAIAFGGCCAGLAALEALMRNIFGTFRSDFAVACDYSAEKTSADVSIVIRLRPVWVAGAALAALGRYIRDPESGLHLLTDGGDRKTPDREKKSH